MHPSFLHSWVIGLGFSCHMWSLVLQPQVQQTELLSALEVSVLLWIIELSFFMSHAKLDISTSSIRYSIVRINHCIQGIVHFRVHCSSEGKWLMVWLGDSKHFGVKTCGCWCLGGHLTLLLAYCKDKTRIESDGPDSDPQVNEPKPQ